LRTAHHDYEGHLQPVIALAACSVKRIISAS
jgi:hypothetical protein